MQDTFWGIARFLPRPLAGEGWGDGVCGRDGVACFSLTLALSQRERELPRRREGLFLFLVWSLSSLTFLLLPACGRKTPVRPPELVAPEPISDLTLEVEGKGIRLLWSRPQKYVDGSDMEDLGGFVVLRATLNGQGKADSFTQLATVTVDDRDRFRKARKFSYTDKQLTAGTLYRYRVQAFTLDGYYSSPSNTVELVWQGGP